MEKDIVDGKIGSVGGYDLAFKEGKLSFKVSAGVGGASVVLGVELVADDVLSALENAIPGKIDDAVFELLKAALKA